MNALPATFVLGFLWAVWHLPSFFYVLDHNIAVGWVFGLLCGAIFLTWLYNSTSDSLLAVALWHGTFNFNTASKAAEGMAAAILSSVVMVWAVLIIFIYKPADLSRQEKQRMQCEKWIRFISTATEHNVQQLSSSSRQMLLQNPYMQMTKEVLWNLAFFIRSFNIVQR